MISRRTGILRICAAIAIGGAMTITAAVNAQESDVDSESIAVLETAFQATEVLSVEEEINSAGKGGPKLSSDGANVVYAVDRENEDGVVSGYVYRRQLPSGSLREIAVVGSGPDFSLTPDGQTVLLRTFPNTKNALYVSNVNGTELIFEEDSGGELVDAVIDGMGERVFLTIRTPTNVVGIDGPISAGLWTIDASGGNLRPVVLLDDLRDYIGAAPGDILYSADPLTMDISDFTGAIVYTIQNITTDESFVLAVDTNDGQIRLLHGPSQFVSRATISGDGSTVFVLDIAQGDTARSPRFTIVGFGGENAHELPPVVAGLSNNLNGLMLNLDGSVLLTSSAGLLMDTTDGFVRNLIPGCPSQIPSSLMKPTMNEQGDKVVFLRQASGENTLVAIDIQNEAVTYEQLNNIVTIETGEISSANTTATVTVSVGDVPSGALVCAIVGNSLEPLVSAVQLRDDGVNSDISAGDGIYTSGPLNLPDDMSSGPKPVRITVETVANDGTLTTDVFDIPDGLKVTT